jgi:methionine biosynthesis protein MetW
MDALRVGRRVVASVPNFGHWKARWQLLSRGRAPVTSSPPYQWYDTPTSTLSPTRTSASFCVSRTSHIVKQFYVGSGARSALAQPARRQRVFVLEDMSRPDVR